MKDVEKQKFIISFKSDDNDVLEGDIVLTIVNSDFLSHFNIRSLDVKQIIDPIPIHHKSLERMTKKQLIDYIYLIGNWLSSNRLKDLY